VYMGRIAKYELRTSISSCMNLWMGLWGLEVSSANIVLSCVGFEYECTIVTVSI